MAKKKKDEEVEGAVAEDAVVEETTVEAAAPAEESASEAAPAEETAVEAAPADQTPADEPVVEAAAEEVEAPVEEPTAVEAAPAVEEKPKKAAKAAPKVAKAEKKADAPADGAVQKTSKRAEKVGIVSSDKMTKTVVVRVDRLVKHPIYRKYVKKRKKFMAHDELGAKIGDKVKIIETRPLSARKRWRVVEIIQKAQL